jgi:hypothetical protein
VTDLNKDNPLGTKGKVAEAYASLLVKLWSGDFRSVSPVQLRSAIGKAESRFDSFQQQDSQELMAFLLDALHEDLNRVRDKPYIEQKSAAGRPDEVVAAEAWTDHTRRNKSIVVDLFQGQLRSELTCPTCHQQSVTFDPFMFLSLPLPSDSKRTIEVVVLRYMSRAQQTKYAVSDSEALPHGGGAPVHRRGGWHRPGAHHYREFRALDDRLVAHRPQAGRRGARLARVDDRVRGARPHRRAAAARAVLPPRARAGQRLLAQVRRRSHDWPAVRGLLSARRHHGAAGSTSWRSSTASAICASTPTRRPTRTTIRPTLSTTTTTTTTPTTTRTTSEDERGGERRAPTCAPGCARSAAVCRREQLRLGALERRRDRPPPSASAVRRARARSRLWCAWSPRTADRARCAARAVQRLHARARATRVVPFDKPGSFLVLDWKPRVLHRDYRRSAISSVLLDKTVHEARESRQLPHISLSSCFNLFSAPERLSAHDEWYCGKCAEARARHQDAHAVEAAAAADHSPEALQLRLAALDAPEAAAHGRLSARQPSTWRRLCSAATAPPASIGSSPSSTTSAALAAATTSPMRAAATRPSPTSGTSSTTCRSRRTRATLSRSRPTLCCTSASSVGAGHDAAAGGAAPNGVPPRRPTAAAARRPKARSASRSASSRRQQWQRRVCDEQRQRRGTAVKAHLKIL